jgi:acyl-coenzyme A synthetase/AMP-(fatty) acid ligase
MVPKYVEFRESLPVTATGKISRRMVAGGRPA